MKAPKKIELTAEQKDELLTRVEKNALQPGDYELIKGAFDMLSYFKEAYDNKQLSNQRLLRMLFGARTEKTKNVLKSDKEKESEDNSRPDDQTPVSEDAVENPDNVAPASNGAGSPGEKDPKKKPEKPRKGHGRNGAGDYTGAETIFTPNTDMKPGDPCALCKKGKVYRMKFPGIIIRLSGSAPVQAKIWEQEKYRCNLCGEIFTATVPEEAKGPKYDETAIAMIALSRYGFGIPFYRLEKLQCCLGIPLAASTQWEKVEAGADRVYRVFEELKRIGAQGDLVHNDDTTIKILELMSQNDESENDDSRKGMFTSSILSIKGDRKIALFFTGRKHAGENMADMLRKREPGKSPPIQMCDALSRNFSEYNAVILVHCNAHSRRRFVDVADNFPEECRYVLEVFEEMYKNDAIAKRRAMSNQERMEFHQEKSGPVMDAFYKWLNEQFDQKKVEPNSGLGQAITYMLKHWKKLTRFLHVPGAPLDNNICEQAIKRAILHRKNSLFYKTLHGAYVGDMYMSLIHTCILNDVNPFDYLTQLQKHSSEVFKNPSHWMPWNYKLTIADLTP